MEHTWTTEVSPKAEARALYRLLKAPESQGLRFDLTEGQRRALVRVRERRADEWWTRVRRATDDLGAPEFLVLSHGLIASHDGALRARFADLVRDAAARIEPEAAGLLAHVVFSVRIVEREASAKRALTRALIALARVQRLPNGVLRGTAQLSIDGLAPAEVDDLNRLREQVAHGDASGR